MKYLASRNFRKNYAKFRNFHFTAKNSRQINYSAISLEERCFHEIFAKKARENFCYFHTVHMHIVEKY